MVKQYLDYEGTKDLVSYARQIDAGMMAKPMLSEREAFAHQSMYNDSYYDEYTKDGILHKYIYWGATNKAKQYLIARLAVGARTWVPSYPSSAKKGTVTYNVGDRVIYDEKVYQCITTNTDTEWTPSKWTYIDDVYTATPLDYILDTGDNNNFKFPDGGAPTCRKIAVYGDYLFMALRSNTSTDGMNTNPASYFGVIKILNRYTYETVKSIKVNARPTGLYITSLSNGSVCLVLNCQMSFVRFYTIDTTDPDILVPQAVHYTDSAYWRSKRSYKVGNWVVYTDGNWYKCITANSDTTFDISKWELVTVPSDVAPTFPSFGGHNDISEFQHASFFKVKDDDPDTYYASAGFGDGISIWKITDVASGSVECVGTWYANNHRLTWPKDTYHTFDCVVNYPYVYGTIAPDSRINRADRSNNTTNGRMGVITYNISDFSNISAKITYIPISDNGLYYGSDGHPINIKMWKDKLFLDNSNRGVTIFDISKPGKPVYMGTKFLNNIWEIGGMEIVDDKYIYVGTVIHTDQNLDPDYKTQERYSAVKYTKMYELYNDYEGLFGGGGDTPEPTDDVYGALIDLDIMEDLSTYDSTTSVNVKDLGAVGDGVTDDSAAFVSALYEASAHGKINILIPHGIYNLNNVAMGVPSGVSLIGENAHNTVLLNNNWSAPNGMTAKNLAFEGGTKRAIANMTWQPTAIIDASPSADTAAHHYENCIFKGISGSITHYASVASQERQGMDYDGTTYHKIASDEIINCIFEDFMYSGIHHCVTIDKARVEGCTFRNIGVIDEVPFDEVTNPSGNPKSQGLAEKSGDLYVATSDTSVVAGHTYYAPKGRAVGALRLGDTSNNTENTATDCVIKGCDFHDVKNNSFYYAPTHSDESNFIKMKGEYVSITHNKFKDLIGYGHDREGVYTKARNCDISYNYIENGGMGEGYICCKDIHNITGHDKYDRIIYIHDNVLVGEGGRGIRTYYGSVIENNTILIKNAKSGIWASGDANTITEIKDNYIALKFDHFYLTDAQSIALYGSDVEPTDYHERTTVIDSILDKATKINGNNIIMWLMLSATYYAISIQRTYQHAEVNDNRIITNGGSGVNISAVSIQDIQLGDTGVKGLLVDVTGNDIRDNYRPIIINLSGIINSKSKVNIKNNTIWEPTSTACEVLLYDEKVYVLTSDTQVVEDKPYFTYNSTTKVFTPVDNPTGNPKSQGWYEYVDNSNKSTVLTYETTNPNAGFTSRHVRTDCKNIVIDDIAMVEHMDPLQK